MKHVFLEIKDIPAKFDELGKCTLKSSLEISLDRLKERGAKILGFERQGNFWLIKAMVPQVES